LGLIAIIIGGLLAVSGFMFALTTLLAASFNKPLPKFMFIPGLVQIGLGLIASTAGFLLRRGNARAKIVLVFVAAGVAVYVAAIGLLTVSFLEKQGP
jgi:hypothetical protein